MKIPRVLFVVLAALGVLLVGIGAGRKNQPKKTPTLAVSAKEDVKELAEVEDKKVETLPPAKEKTASPKEKKEIREVKESTTYSPDVDHIHQLFSFGSDRLPIVETVTYTSRVSWLKGRPAWIADYASYYKTSRHFIARGLNRKADYLTQKVAPGDRFNVFRSDVNFEFYLLVDVSKCKMWFYYVDLDKNEKVLLKTYRVGLGLPDSKSPSGTITPLGKFMLGDKIASYKPGVMGFFQNERIEMINIFGTRWLPFKGIEADQEAYAKGYGIHGAPMYFDEKAEKLTEQTESIGKYASSGCVRLLQEDVEEIYAIVVTRPTTVEIVKEAESSTEGK